MTPSMWLTLVASVGMATLVIPVARARHELAAPLGVLIADMLVWNLAWLAYQLSGNERWHWLVQCAASVVMVLGLDFVLTFVGRRRALFGVRRLAFIFHGVAFATVASRFIVSDDALYVGDEVWRRGIAVAAAAIAVLVGWLLFAHYRTQRDAAERAHTRLLVNGAVLWLILAATDVLHHRLSSVPQMSALGMLVSAAVMAIVMDRIRADGPSRWWVLYTVTLFVVAVCGNVVVFKTFPTPTAMLFARTVIFVVVGVVAAREVIVMFIRRRQSLAELALLGRVTAQMAHDLQNPLAAIKCAAQVIEEDQLRGGDSRRQARMLATIADQVNRLSGIVDDYRRVGRIEPRVQPLALAQVLRRIARPANIDLDVRLGGLPFCLADQELVARALDNLVRNAAEAMPSGGTVTVTGETVGDGDARWVDVTIADDGPGMDARTCERAFDDFFTTKSRGSGLGLAYVRRVAEAHGGAARITSRIGRGTSVTIRLPAATESTTFITQRAAA